MASFDEKLIEEDVEAPAEEVPHGSYVSMDHPRISRKTMQRCFDFFLCCVYVLGFYNVMIAFKQVGDFHVIQELNVSHTRYYNMKQIFNIVVEEWNDFGIDYQLENDIQKCFTLNETISIYKCKYISGSLDILSDHLESIIEYDYSISKDAIEKAVKFAIFLDKNQLPIEPYLKQYFNLTKEEREWHPKLIKSHLRSTLLQSSTNITLI